MPVLKIQSADKKVFEVELNVAKCSGTIRTMVEDLGLDEEDGGIIPLPHINSVILGKVLEWAHHHVDDPTPVNSDEPNWKYIDEISSWDKEFMNIDQGTLLEMILAANYLDIKGLLDLACRTVANMIKGQSSEEMRKTLNITNDFSPEEEEQMLKENEWCEENVL